MNATYCGFVLRGSRTVSIWMVFPGDFSTKVVRHDTYPISKPNAQHRSTPISHPWHPWPLECIFSPSWNFCRYCDDSHPSSPGHGETGRDMVLPGWLAWKMTKALGGKKSEQVRDENHQQVYLSTINPCWIVLGLLGWLVP